MGRPLQFPKKQQISVIMADDEKRALRSFAKSQGKKVSSCVRSLILDAIKAA